MQNLLLASNPPHPAPFIGPLLSDPAPGDPGFIGPLPAPVGWPTTDPDCYMCGADGFNVVADVRLCDECFREEE